MPESPPRTTKYLVTTASTPGAVAIVQVIGEQALDVLRRVTGRDDWPLHAVRFARFGEIDEGLAVLLREDIAQLMPHGGPRVVQRLVAMLEAMGVATASGARHTASDGVSAATIYPEARSGIEADMLAALAEAASPAAIDLLLAQPALWRKHLDAIEKAEAIDGDAAEHMVMLAPYSRAESLKHLLTPPSVVVVGKPNVGKSTLTNRLLGRAASIVADLPGTTRDWVMGIAELLPHAERLEQGQGQDLTRDAVAVRWLDTPGIHASDDPIEQQAISMAQRMIDTADVLIAMNAPGVDWPTLRRPDGEGTARWPDLWVTNKADTLAQKLSPREGAKPDELQTPATTFGEESEVGGLPDTPLLIGAKHGEGIDRLQHAVLSRLGLDDLAVDTRWAFSETLRQHAQNGAVLREYLGIDGTT